MNSELIHAAGLILAGLVLLVLGGEALVRGSVGLALRLGITPLVAGLTVVAMGTSAPELMVTIQAALSGRGAIGAGNVVGSNILNIGLILGLTVVLAPMKVQASTLRADMPILILVTIVGIGVLWDAHVSRIEGAILFAMLVSYIAFTIRTTRDTRTAPADEVARHSTPVRTLKDTAFVAAGIGLLVLGARWLVDGAVPVARHFGMSEAAIGLTIIATGTSMPEIATSVVAALRKESQIALGNIIGSNIFNILAILGIAAIIQPLDTPGIALRDVLVMLAFAVVLVPFASTGLRFARWEGALLLLGYAAYIACLWP